jgi:cysteinyl-tRNA synthetase
MERSIAKKGRDFDTADSIRDQLEKQLYPSHIKHKTIIYTYRL